MCAGGETQNGREDDEESKKEYYHIQSKIFSKKKGQCFPSCCCCDRNVCGMRTGGKTSCFFFFFLSLTLLKYISITHSRKEMVDSISFGCYSDPHIQKRCGAIQFDLKKKEEQNVRHSKCFFENDQKKFCMIFWFFFFLSFFTG